MEINKPVIAFLARAGSGKSTAAEYVIKRYGIERISFAAPLKELAMRLWGLDHEQVYGSKKETFSVTIRGVTTTPRSLLQLLGNEAREILGPNVWINAAINAMENSSAPGFVIDDCRYVNEAVAISALPNGHVIKIESPDRKSNADPNHPSEAEVDKVPLELLRGVVMNRQEDGLASFHHTLHAITKPVFVK